MIVIADANLIFYKSTHTQKKILKSEAATVYQSNCISSEVRLTLSPLQTALVQSKTMNLEEPTELLSVERLKYKLNLLIMLILYEGY